MQITDAKQRLQEQYTEREGLVGVGIGRLNNRSVLRVYVTNRNAPVAIQLSGRGQFEGFPVEIKVSGSIHSLPQHK